MEDDHKLYQLQYNDALNCSQGSANCSWNSWNQSEREFTWLEDDGNFSSKFNETPILCSGSIAEPFDDEDHGNRLFKFIVLGIGISVVAILGKCNCHIYFESI